jgi:hypothetical protein
MIYEGNLISNLNAAVDKVLPMPARPMERVWQSLLHHDGYGYGKHDSIALARIYSNGIGAVVILTEPKGNTGASVTNCYERIALKLRTALGQFIPLENYPEKVTFLEQYESAPNEISLVTMTWDSTLLRFSHPKWRALTEGLAFRDIPWAELCRIPQH